MVLRRDRTCPDRKRQIREGPSHVTHWTVQASRTTPLFIQVLAETRLLGG